MKPLVIVKVGTTFPTLVKDYGDVEHWIQAGMGDISNPIVIVDPRLGGEMPDPQQVSGVVVTGSRAMVTDRAEWSEALAIWLRKLVMHDVPTLGICYGHQVLAYALGGDVGYHPGGVEAGTVSIRRTEQALDDDLFHGLPPLFPVQAIHWQSVRTLPLGAVLLAGNQFEPHHAFRIGKSAWGIQFHPEFSSNVMYEYICRMGPELTEAGKNVETLLGEINRTDWAALVLKRFGAIVQSQVLQMQEVAPLA
jgi:GMP synthase (glutamine-hydrolysing)